jgi:hypothetical protein
MVSLTSTVVALQTADSSADQLERQQAASLGGQAQSVDQITSLFKGSTRTTDAE